MYEYILNCFYIMLQCDTVTKTQNAGTGHISAKIWRSIQEQIYSVTWGGNPIQFGEGAYLETITENNLLLIV